MLNTLSSTMHLNAIDNVVIARAEIPEGTDAARSRRHRSSAHSARPQDGDRRHR